MRKPFDADTFESEIARLRDLDLPDLRAVWEQHYGVSVPRTLRRNMLVLSIGWRIQADALGDLKLATRKYLRQVSAVAAGASGPVAVKPIAKIRIKPGTRLIRVWQDKTHTVTALPDGFEWQGRRHRSLSEIARLITGTRWNGLVFFGVKPRPSEPKLAAAGKARQPEVSHA